MMAGAWERMASSGMLTRSGASSRSDVPSCSDALSRSLVSPCSRAYASALSCAPARDNLCGMRIAAAQVRLAVMLVAVVALVALAAVLALPGAAWARGAIDVGASCSLAVESAPAGAQLELYRVAALDESGVVGEPTEFFASYAVDLAPESDAGWRALAQTLSAYAARDGAEPCASGVADAHGRLAFSDLTTGLYLLAGKGVSNAEGSYSVEPVMVQLPGLDTSTGADLWTYDVVTRLKWGTDVLTSVTAVKVWDDAGTSVERPSSVVVQLLRDGEVQDTFELSDANNWRHTWEGLDPAHVWQVVEAGAPEGYETTVSREGSVFTVRNSAVPPEPSVPSVPDDSTPDGTLPQTGQLWWPVPLLVAAGLALCLAGIVRRNHARK